MDSLPEPWLRGPVPGVDPLIGPTLYAFQHAREDLARYTEGLTPEQIWTTPHGFGSVGFHIRHIGGSVERLTTYVQGKQLSPEQLHAVGTEKDAGASRQELLAKLDADLLAAESLIRSLDPSRLTEPREVGRKRLPTTVMGLIVHMAEHTQRHIGQAISAAKWARATTDPGK
jgi:hypothetical protein